MTTRLCDDGKHDLCQSFGGEVSTIVPTGPKTVWWGKPKPCACNCHERKRYRCG